MIFTLVSLLVYLRWNLYKDCMCSTVVSCDSGGWEVTQCFSSKWVSPRLFNNYEIIYRRKNLKILQIFLFPPVPYCLSLHSSIVLWCTGRISKWRRWKAHVSADRGHTGSICHHAATQHRQSIRWIPLLSLSTRFIETRIKTRRVRANERRNVFVSL